MRIVYLHQYFNTPDMVGGSRTYEMARRWARAGHDVHVVTSRRDDGAGRDAPSVERIEGFTVHWRSVPYRNDMTIAQRAAAFLRFAVGSAGLARRLRGDVVFATSTPLTIVLPALWATLMRRTPMVFEVRDVWPAVPIAMGALRNPIVRAAAQLLERIAYRRATRIVALSPDMAHEVQSVGVPAEKIVVATNASDIERFDVPPSVGREFRSAHPWLADRPLIVYCGALGRVNGVGYLAEVARHLAELGSNAVIAVFGRGAEQPKVRDRAAELGVLEENFFLLDPVPKYRLPEILSAATICTSVVIPIPILAANSANKFFDALAAGRPIMINHEGWQADVIRSARAGLVIPGTDPRAAAEIIQDWLELPEDEREAYNRRARDLAEKEYSRDLIAARVLHTIEGAVHEGPTRLAPADR